MRKKGFTLIELLAVIIILGIIALICFVSVNSVLKDSKGSLKDIQIKNIEKAAEAYYIKEGMPVNTNCIDVSELISLGYIEGEAITNPENKEQMNGSVKIKYIANKYSYEYMNRSCNVICEAVTAANKTTGNIPSTTAGFAAGDEYICDVNNTDSYHFFVLGTTGDNVNLIMDRNITSDGTPATASNPGTVQWINESDYTFAGGPVAWNYTSNGVAKSGDNSKGPVTAMKYLELATSSWTNIDKYDYDFEVKNIAVNSVKDYTNQFEPYGTSGYTSYSGGSYFFRYYSKARLILVEEAFLAGCKFESSDKTPNKACPLWLSNYLYYRDFRTGASSYLGAMPSGVTPIENANIRGYWTLNGNGNSGDQNIAFEIYDHININSTYVYRENYNGVRPVITLPKSKIK